MCKKQQPLVVWSLVVEVGLVEFGTNFAGALQVARQPKRDSHFVLHERIVGFHAAKHAD